MKKNHYGKIIFLTILILVVGSWFIPTSTFVDGTFTKAGYSPMGILDILFAPLQWFNWEFVGRQLFTDGTSVLAYTYTGILLFILMTGIFYAILGKTGAYGNLITKISKKLEDKKILALVGTAIFFFLFSSLIGVRLLAFLLIPFFISILLKLKHSRISAFSATFLPVLLGSAVSITGSEVSGVNRVLFSTAISGQMILKIIFYLLFLLAFLFYLLYKREPRLEKEELEEYEVDSKKKTTPIILLSIFFFVILFVTSFNWYYVFDMPQVTNAYESMKEVMIGNYPIGNILIGMMEPFGYWTGFTMSGVLALFSLILVFLYSIPLESVKEAMVAGCKRMVKPILAIVVAMIPMVLISNYGTGIFVTISSWIYRPLSHVVTLFTSIVMFLHSFFVGDYFAAASLTSSVMPTLEGVTMDLSILSMQIVHGVVSVVAPTSIFLVAGLGYLHIPYQKWLSYIWRLALLLLVLGVVAITVVGVVS